MKQQKKTKKQSSSFFPRILWVIKNTDLSTPEAEPQEWLIRLRLVRRQVLGLQTPLCSAGSVAAAAAAGLHATWHRQLSLAVRRLTVHVVPQRCLQLGQRVAPGAELQQPQRRRRAQRRHDEVGAVLRLGERPVEADGEPAVELVHAVLQAAVAVAPLHQARADQERSHRQATHILSGGVEGKHPQGCGKEAPKTKSCEPLMNFFFFFLKREMEGMQSDKSSNTLK